MKTTSTSWDYIFQLKKKDVTGIMKNYFTDDTQINISRRCHGEKKYSNLKTFYNYLNQVQILQFNLEDIEIENEKSTFKLMLITKNKQNQIDFTQHNISNKWKGNKIIEHDHIIISY
mgnify:CR=1 FL=1